MIHQLREEGLSVSAIARRAGMDRKTVRKYLKAGLKAPSYGPRAPLLDPYRSYPGEQVQVATCLPWRMFSTLVQVFWKPSQKRLLLSKPI